MMGYIEGNHFSGEFGNFGELFTPAYNLWKPFGSDSVVGLQYEKFMEIVIVSALQAYDLFWGEKDFALQRIEKILQDKGLRKKFDYLMQ